MLSGDLKTTNSLEDALSVYSKVSDLCFRFISPLYRIVLTDVMRSEVESHMVKAVLSRVIAVSISSALSKNILVKVNSDYFDEAKKRAMEIKGYSLLTALLDVICIETFVDNFEEVVDFIKGVRVLSTRYGINDQGYPYLVSVRLQKTDVSMPVTVVFKWRKEFDFDMMSEFKRLSDR